MPVYVSTMGLYGDPATLTVVGAQPIRPTGTTWRWGQNDTVDAVVLAAARGRRHLLMVCRRDCGEWALPGGFRYVGEDPAYAAAREVHEETGINLIWDYPRVQPLPQRPRLVDDPRCTPWAWIVTTPVVWDLGALAELPPVRGGDDATEALWLPAGTYAELEAAADARGGLYEPHRPILRDLLA